MDLHVYAMADLELKLQQKHNASLLHTVFNKMPTETCFLHLLLHFLPHLPLCLGQVFELLI